MRISLIGGGVMGESVICGVLNKGISTPQEIIVSDINDDRRKFLKETHGIEVSADNRLAIAKAEIIILSVLPRTLPSVVQDLNGSLNSNQIVLSILAGTPITTISQGLNHETIARAMPNMPAQIGEGITVWTTTNKVNQRQKAKVSAVVGSLGKELYVSEETYIDMATAVSGSGPAYVLLVIEAYIDAAVHIGIPRELAEELVLNTISGTTHFAQQAGKHPAELRNLVTSPGGTTTEGLLCLEEGSIRALFTQAISASYEKAQLLSRR